MRKPATLRPLCLACAMVAGAAHAQSDLDALALQSAPDTKASTTAPYRLTLEGALGRISGRNGLEDESARRATVDFRYGQTVAPGWRVNFSDRFDAVHPMPQTGHRGVNSLREAFVGWQAEDAASSVDVGRINARYGPAYGYNPSDFFRTQALRVVTTADPIALREMRLGVFMARGTRQWGDTSATVMLAPKLQKRPDNGTWSLDAGSTNGANRAVAVVSTKWSDRLSTQVLGLGEEHLGGRVGANVSGLVTDSLVGFGEFSYGRGRTVAGQVWGTGQRKRFGQAAVGLTYTSASKLSVTAEAEYNGGGLSDRQWQDTLAGGPALYGRYLDYTQRSQELGSRRAWLVYLTQRELGLKQLELSAFVRVNANDQSRLAWLELRHHWSQFDLALQVQRASGKNTSEFGTLPVRSIVQVVAGWYL